MTYTNVVIAGGGTLGSQIAYMSAYSGKNVTIWGRAEHSLESAKARVARWEKAVQAYFKSSDAQIADARKNLTYTTNLQEALKDADLVIEALPESINVKKDFYEKFGQIADKKVVIASNSSTMLTSDLAKFVDRPEQFLNYHFANNIWRGNTAEIMPSAKTDPQLPATFVEFSHEIKMVPILINKEQPGYVLNSMLVPFLDSATDLWVNDIAQPQDIDKTWMIATGAPMGPFAIMDVVGMNTVYQINAAKKNPEAQKVAQKIKAMIDNNQIGVESGAGFYTYPNPEYKQADFLKG